MILASSEFESRSHDVAWLWGKAGCTVSVCQTLCQDRIFTAARGQRRRFKGKQCQEDAGGPLPHLFSALHTVTAQSQHVQKCAESRFLNRTFPLPCMQVAKAVSHSLNNCVNCLPGQKDVDVALKSIGESSKKLLVDSVRGLGLGRGSGNGAHCGCAWGLFSSPSAFS